MIFLINSASEENWIEVSLPIKHLEMLMVKEQTLRKKQNRTEQKTKQKNPAKTTTTKTQKWVPWPSIYLRREILRNGKRQGKEESEIWTGTESHPDHSCLEKRTSNWAKFIPRCSSGDPACVTSAGKERPTPGSEHLSAAMPLLGNTEIHTNLRWFPLL